MVYGLQGNEDKHDFLWELRTIRAQCAGLWMLVGDFNMIYKDEDKSNSNPNRVLMGHFRRLIDDVAIKVLPLSGHKFTWTSSSLSTSPTLLKLDRVFCSADWEEYFPSCLLQSAASEDSDH